MESDTKKFVRIQLSHPGYDVPADRKDMIDMAVDALYDDVMNAVKFNEMDEWIEVVDSDATEVDIPSFITEICNDEE